MSGFSYWAFQKLGATAFVAIGLFAAGTAQADFTTAAYRLAVAEAASSDDDIAEFYKGYEYQPLWTGRNREDRDRRAAFIETVENSSFHGLPVERYDIPGLIEQLKQARTQADLAEVEVAFTEAFLEYAQNLQTGVLVPSEVDEQIVRKVPYRDRLSYLTSLAQSTPAPYFRALAPQSPEYVRLARKKMHLQELVSKGGWGAPVPEDASIKPDQKGWRVVALRNRLILMGYLEPNYSDVYDLRMFEAVKAFQDAHGLDVDGVAGPSTLGEINVPADTRLKSVIVAMERERWTNMERGKRHVLVNLADFKARIFDDGKVTFQTRSVIGHPDEDRRSPEFSDEIEHMIINPTWNVPRSIATKEYLPLLQEDPLALDYLNLLDTEGEIVPREGLDFTTFTEEDFPFDMKQPPSNTNALGLVKFMFPNVNNIYLHDTPAKNLFGREVRAFSHGCIRLQQPFEFAYALLAPQSEEPEVQFHEALDTGLETQIDLDEHVPVHLIYRTAIANPDGQMEYRRDIYGRDAAIWTALENAGVALLPQEG